MTERKGAWKRATAVDVGLVPLLVGGRLADVTTYR